MEDGADSPAQALVNEMLLSARAEREKVGRQTLISAVEEQGGDLLRDLVQALGDGDPEAVRAARLLQASYTARRLKEEEDAEEEEAEFIAQAYLAQHLRTHWRQKRARERADPGAVAMEEAMEQRALGGGILPPDAATLRPAVLTAGSGARAPTLTGGEQRRRAR